MKRTSQSVTRYLCLNTWSQLVASFGKVGKVAELLGDGAFQGEAVTSGGPWGFLACPIHSLLPEYGCTVTSQSPLLLPCLPQRNMAPQEV